VVSFAGSLRNSLASDDGGHGAFRAFAHPTVVSSARSLRNSLVSDDGGHGAFRAFAHPTVVSSAGSPTQQSRER